jgi:hypothetical protein
MSECCRVWGAEARHGSAGARPSVGGVRGAMSGPPTFNHDR